MTIQKSTGGNLLRLTAGTMAKECCCGGTTPASACATYPDCTGHAGDAGVAPSNQLTVFDADHVGSISWCGKTWTQEEVRAGTPKCVCPTFYEVSVGYSRSSNWNYWRYGTELRLERFINAGGAGANILDINVGAGAVSSYYWHYFTLGNTSTTTASTSGGGFPPQQAKTVITAATSKYQGFLQDGYFNVTYTSGGVQYSWARGTNWP